MSQNSREGETKNTLETMLYKIKRDWASNIKFIQCKDLERGKTVESKRFYFMLTKDSNEPINKQGFDMRTEIDPLLMEHQHC